ncbi:MAG: GntR family transcriptional regulator [Bryobacteraceae bacterium]
MKPKRKVRTSASERVERYVKQAILDGQLKPRERIIEDDLALQLRCSRGPVREAVLRLERDGLIVITPRRGTFVRDVSPKEVEVVFSIRAKLEALSVRYMRGHLSRPIRQALENCLQKLKAAAEAEDNEAFIYADMELHQTIWKASQREVLSRTLNTVMNPFIFMIARAYSGQTPIQERYRRHEEYVAMVLDGPLHTIEQKVEEHFRSLFENLRLMSHAHYPVVPAGRT